jgi:hypothetical protein
MGTETVSVRGRWLEHEEIVAASHNSDIDLRDIAQPNEVCSIAETADEPELGRRQEVLRPLLGCVIHVCGRWDYSSDVSDVEVIRVIELNNANHCRALSRTVGEQQHHFLLDSFEKKPPEGHESDLSELCCEVSAQLRRVGDLHDLCRQHEPESSSRCERAGRCDYEGHPRIGEPIRLQAFGPHEPERRLTLLLREELVPDERRIADHGIEFPRLALREREKVRDVNFGVTAGTSPSLPRLNRIELDAYELSATDRGEP